MLHNIENSKYCSSHTHENNTLFEKLCTKADLTSIENKVNPHYIKEACTQERQNTNWRFNLIIYVTIFAALPKNILMGSPDSLILETLLKNQQVNCLISDSRQQAYNDNLCLFRALA